MKIYKYIYKFLYNLKVVLVIKLYESDVALIKIYYVNNCKKNCKIFMSLALREKEGLGFGWLGWWMGTANE